MPDVWANFEGSAAYLSWLVVGRAFAGTGLGERVVAEAEIWAKKNHLSSLRLDCWAGNAKLRRFYRNLEFCERANVREKDYEVTLFEKDL